MKVEKTIDFASTRYQTNIPSTLQISLNSPFVPWLARHRVAVQARVPKGRAWPGQEDLGEDHREAGPPHLLPVPARPPHRPRHPTQRLHREGGQSESHSITPETFFLLETL